MNEREWRLRAVSFSATILIKAGAISCTVVS
jgi:hypothetical protein